MGALWIPRELQRVPMAKLGTNHREAGPVPPVREANHREADPTVELLAWPPHLQQPQKMYRSKCLPLESGASLMKNWLVMSNSEGVSSGTSRWP